MAPVLSPRELDGGAPNTDALGMMWVVMAILYTIVVGGELYMLYRYRSTFCVRIRGFKVVVSAVSMLHVYLVLVLLVYPWNGLFPCSAEFWVMSIFLPSGMALFQGTYPRRYCKYITHIYVACNAKVLTAYESQRRLTRNFLEGARRKRLSYTPQGLWSAWLELDATMKVHICTLTGLAVSVSQSFVLLVTLS
jgi:hypothetical protein